jgi:DNA-directed RNA polymerase specialized sigma24 family protein
MPADSTSAARPPARAGWTRDKPSGVQAADLPDPNSGLSDDFHLWSACHERVDQLPVEEREVFGLTFYRGWAQAQVAELFQVDERTIRRRWRCAA